MATVSAQRPFAAPGDHWPVAIKQDLRLPAIITIAGTLGLLLTICAIAVWLLLANQQAARAVSRGDTLETIVISLRESVLSAEAAQRGYMLTGRDVYLQPYNQARRAVEDRIAELSGMQEFVAERGRLLTTLTDSIARKFEEMSNTITLMSGGKAEEARALVNSDIGVGLTRQISDLVATVLEQLREDHVEASGRQVATIRGLMIAIGLAAVCAIGLAAIALLQLASHIHILRGREQELDGLVDELEVRIAGRTQQLAEANQRFEIATRTAGVTVYSQDRDLRFTSISQSFRGRTPSEIIGRTEYDILPEATARSLSRIKERVLETGEAETTEIRLRFDDEEIWLDAVMIPMRGPGGEVTGLLGASMDITERKRSEAHVRLLMRELSHRSKNLLAVVLALIRQTVASAQSPEDFSQRMTERLQSLASSYDLLIKDDWRGAPLEALLQSQVAHYGDIDSRQIQMRGPVLYLGPDMTQNLGMALHELATNAAKYGALSVPSGRVEVTWDVADRDGQQSLCTITWQESGGPVVQKPARRGFGQVVIERSVARALNGSVDLSYAPEGFRWTLIFPIDKPAEDAALSI